MNPTGSVSLRPSELMTNGPASSLARDVTLSDVMNAGRDLDDL